MATQRNYLINTTTLSTTASGTTIGSGNVSAAGFVVARTLVRSGIGAGEFASGSQTWAIHYVVSAMTTPYNMRLKVQRRNSGGTMQAESGYGTTRSATGTYDDNLTADLGTWAANDQLALVWEHERPSGTGNKNGTMDANGSSYIDAPLPVLDLTQTPSDSANNLADALAKTVGLPNAFAESINNLADAHSEIIGIPITLSDNTNLLTDYFTYGRHPRWLDNLAKTLDSSPALALSLSDDLNNLADAYSQVGPISITSAETINAWLDYFTYGRRPRWLDSESQIADLRISFADSIDNLTDAVITAIVQRVTAAESINNLADAHAEILGLNETPSDSFTLSDSSSMIEGQLVPCTDSFSLTDNYSQVLEQRIQIAESGNNLADALAVVEGQLLSLSDNANNLNDSIALRLEHRISLTENANNLADVLSMIGGQQLSLADNANNLADDLTFEVPTNALTRTLADNLNNWVDSSALLLDHRLALAESINSLADATVLWTNGLLPLADTLSTLADGAALREGELLGLSDALSLTDSYAQSVDQRATFSDSFTLTDTTTVLIDKRITCSDSFTLTDSVSLRIEYQIQASDSIALTDSETARMDYFLAVSDALDPMSETFATSGGGVFAEDSFVLSDQFSFAVGGHLECSDDMNNLTDEETHNIPFPALVAKVFRDSRRVVVKP